MAVKLTKNELKVQKDRLKQFQRYLPTLQLKKQQLHLAAESLGQGVQSGNLPQADSGRIDPKGIVRHVVSDLLKA